MLVGMVGTRGAGRPGPSSGAREGRLWSAPFHPGPLSRASLGSVGKVSFPPCSPTSSTETEPRRSLF